jgi:7,8-dihydropterin-6-yl-methyl-4-(beta-D-ribofuranosyl)aminobenzene 5'-phosphate synthase
MTQDSIRISILVNNQAGPCLIDEYGFSLWIETDERRILFDTGQGGALEPNSQALGVNLSLADILVLSHGHYDHTGGIPKALRQNSRAIIYAHPGIRQVRYSIRNKIPKPIQIPTDSKSVLDRLPDERIHWVTEPFQFSETIGLTGPIPRETTYEDTGGPFYLDPEGKTPDLITDDLALWIKTDEGLVLCTGCCHAGLVNTLNHVQRLSGEYRIRAVIGGFHLLNSDDQRLEHTITALRSLNPAKVIPCHCTGEKATQLLIDTFGDKVLPGQAGMVLQF